MYGEEKKAGTDFSRRHSVLFDIVLFCVASLTRRSLLVMWLYAQLTVHADKVSDITFATPKENSRLTRDICNSNFLQKFILLTICLYHNRRNGHE